MSLPVALLFLPWIAAQGGASEGAVQPPVLEKFVPPRYPPEIEDARTATVTLALEIQVDGTVANVEVVESGGAEFDREAIAAGKQLVFRPATLEGVPVPVRVLYRYAFTVRIERAPAEPAVNLEGTVSDREGTAIPDVSVELMLETSTITASSTVAPTISSTTTDANGRFAFVDVPPGYHQLRFSGPGLVTMNIEQAVIPGEKAEVRIALERSRDEDSARIDEEEVVRAPRVRREIAKTRIAAAEARKVPGTQGDTVRVVETMGGVGRAAAGSGNLVVWGASPSDTRSYVDGILVPRLFHLGGSRSVIASELVSAVDLVPGGFGAEYGRAVGGLIRVETAQSKEESGVHGHVAADLIDASLGARVNFGRWSISAAGRKSLLDRTFGAFADERAQELIPIPSYWDYQSKLSYHDAGDTLSLLLFGAEDSVSRRTPSPDPTLVTSEDIRFGFHRLGVRFERLSSAGSSLEIVPWVGIDRNERSSNFGGVPAGLIQTTYRGAVRASDRRRFLEFLTLRSGLDVEGSHSRASRSGALALPPREGDIVAFGLPPGDRTNTDDWQVSLASVAAHATAEFDLLDGTLLIEPGLRFELTILDGNRVLPVNGREPPIGYTELDGNVDPRLGLSWQPLDPLSFHAAVGYYHQPPDPADLSPVFGSPVLDPIAGLHSVLGVKVDILSLISVELTGFYVQLSHLSVRSSLPTPAQGSALVSTGEGRNYGGQLTFRAKIFEGLLGWMTYSLTRAERRDASDLGWRLFDADQTHNLSAVASWEIGAGFDLGARFRYTSGFPRTPVIGAFYDARAGDYDPIYGEQNSIRLPNFIDLSLRLGYHYDFDWGKIEAFLDVQNVINRRNAEEILYTSDFSEREYISGTPILPVVGARLEI